MHVSMELQKLVFCKVCCFHIILLIKSVEFLNGCLIVEDLDKYIPVINKLLGPYCFRLVRLSVLADARYIIG